MKVGVAQIQPYKGDIQKNINMHKNWIEIASSEHADIIVFPELSLTAYEPKLAEKLAFDKDDKRLNDFQSISDRNHISIGLGLPIRTADGICISMMIFQPYQTRKIYSKQSLHPDELPYFTAGTEQFIITVKNKKIAFGICYESLQKAHAEKASTLGAEIYLASVAKSQSSINKGYRHYPKIAKYFAMPVLMANSVGFCDDFQSAGQSAVWNAKGILKDQLKSDRTGILIFDTKIEAIIKKENK